MFLLIGFRLIHFSCDRIGGRSYSTTMEFLQ